jgi:Ca2+-binding RTX toxin-like protein
MDMAVTATFSPAAGVLTVTGDALNNPIRIGRNTAGNILIDGGAVVITGGAPTVANTSLIQVFGEDGNDAILLDETNGPLPPANLFGGVGNDRVAGGSVGGQLFGESGDDVLLGRGGADRLDGGDGNDQLTGGDGDDQNFGGMGDDRMVWNAADDTDLFEGGDGIDTAEANGSNFAEVFSVTANGTRVRFDELTPAPSSIDIGTMENLVINMNGGNDSFSATGNLAALIGITVDGGTGNDTILGSNGADRLLGGDGDDFIDGQQGNDLALLGAGDDLFQWDPGDGSDVVEGQAGTDTLLFNGSGVNEVFDLSANGQRLRFTRNVGNVVMDLDDVETVTINALVGVDTVTVNELTGTDVTQVNVDLAGTLGGATGDAVADTVIVNGTNGNNTVGVLGAGTSASVVGLPARVAITNAEGANDALVINALGGDDTITATALPAGIVSLTIDGGAGNDTVHGSLGGDRILGGDGNDLVFGDNGDDVAFLGAGDDEFEWDPGDGSDTIEGQDGLDTMLFFGSNASENIDIAANGGRVRFFRNVGNVTMDLDDVEDINFHALGGIDNIVVGDLAGTDVTRIVLDLSGPSGGGDGQADTVTVNGTTGGDVFGVAGGAAGINGFGLQASVSIIFPEVANDRLVLNGQAGDDVIDATDLQAGAIQLTINGGLGADLLLGSAGGDLFNGGDGDDVALMGAGDDTFVWNPGDDNDILEGQAGLDTLVFNGANISEFIDVAANGGRVRLFRDVGTVVLDLNDVETIDLHALGGIDTIAVNDLSGTDVAKVKVDLAAIPGGTVGDTQPDTVVVAGTTGADAVNIASLGGAASIKGLLRRWRSRTRTRLTPSPSTPSAAPTSSRWATWLAPASPRSMSTWARPTVRPTRWSSTRHQAQTR